MEKRSRRKFTREFKDGKSERRLNLLREPTLPILITLTVIGVGGLVYPFGGQLTSWLLVSLLVLLNAWLLWTPSASSQRITEWIGARPAVRNFLLIVMPSVIVFGWVEVFAQVATRNDWLPYHAPMVTMLPDGREDWRLAHITSDVFREPDPVLLWRPVASYPYNSHRSLARKSPSVV